MVKFQMKTFKLCDLSLLKDGDMEVYKGVLICYDEVKDLRVRKFVRKLTPDDRYNLLIAYERGGALSLVWDADGWIPWHLQAGKCVQMQGFRWTIETSWYSTPSQD